MGSVVVQMPGSGSRPAKGLVEPLSAASHSPYSPLRSIRSARSARATAAARSPVPTPSLKSSEAARCVRVISSFVYPLRFSPSKFTPWSTTRSPFPRMAAGTSPSTMEPPARKAYEPISQKGQTATAPPSTAEWPTRTWPARRVLFAMMLRDPTTQSCATWHPPMIRLLLPTTVHRSGIEDRWICTASRMSLLLPITRKHSSPLYLRSWQSTPTSELCPKVFRSPMTVAPACSEPMMAPARRVLSDPSREWPKMCAPGPSLQRSPRVTSPPTVQNGPTTTPSPKVALGSTIAVG
mmetsp:Transcript_35841/g.78259  ORF Transcript_35841/g.78259 Transcript_35841/m.78259 type:complete len:294 (-) Transcript_35841:555-1436(-)